MIHDHKKLFDIRTVPDHLWYNRWDWHQRKMSVDRSVQQTEWIKQFCQDTVIVDHTMSVDTFIWFKDDADCVAWDICWGGTS